MPRTSIYRASIDKLIHGGQGLGALSDGKRALVWNSLPGEEVSFRATKKKSSYLEGIAEEIIRPSPDRETPKDELYLSTSPWQMMTYEAENRYKQEILMETLTRAGVNYGREILFHAPKDQWNYRNKMEYSFYGDDQGLHLALFHRGTHRKHIVKGSSIARPEVDIAANKICEVLEKGNTRASSLRSVIVRCSQAGEVVAALFVKDDNFPEMSSLEKCCKGVTIVFSNPKSPASVRTKDLYRFGDISLSDKLLGKRVSYDVFSFFQVNLPIFEGALGFIDSVVGSDRVVDLYGGVGAIGAMFPGTRLLIEGDETNIEWAKYNLRNNNAKILHQSSEDGYEHIKPEDIVVVDPPRAGLHRKLVDALNEIKPKKIVYLSCNPSTQGRDLKLLGSNYKVRSLHGYNFFPRTPHIESLAILEKP